MFEIEIVAQMLLFHFHTIMIKLPGLGFFWVMINIAAEEKKKNVAKEID